MMFSREHGLARIWSPRAVLFDFYLIEFVLQQLDQAIAFITRQFQVHVVHGLLLKNESLEYLTSDSRAKKIAEGAIIGTTLGSNGVSVTT
jgi:hypothetical protein